MLLASGLVAAVLSLGFRPLSLALTAASNATPPVTQPAVVDEFEGQDRFDVVRSLDELRQLEREIMDVVMRVRPSVVLLRGTGPNGTQGSASAVIIGKDGLLATCGHVGRRPGREITALLPDGTELRGRTLGQCFEEGIDCGLVQLETEGRELPAVEMGTTKGLAEGDWVIALGYTHGLAEGSRPALVRVGRTIGIKEKELFIDAPIDAGDSGGPSFNLRGEVIGLNARCGKASWNNIATPVDRLSERMETLLAQREPEDSPTQTRDPSRRGGLPLGREPDTTGKRELERSVPLDGLVEPAVAAMVQVYCDERRVAFGLVVDANGLIVTKASQIEAGSVLEIESAAGCRHAAEVAGRDQQADVALLRLIGNAKAADDGTAERLEPVQWATDTVIAPGAVLVTPRGRGLRPALGFAAIERRESEADLMDVPYLGVQTRPSNPAERRRAEVDRAVTVVRVLPGTAAERAGLKPGQILLSLDGADLGSPEELRRLLRERAIGQRIQLRTLDGERIAPQEATLDIVLSSRADSPQGNSRGNTSTPISRRSSGFGALLAHDTVTEPLEMGSPLVDVNGRIVGMNIARFDRTATHAIAADRMVEICRSLSEQLRSEADDATSKPRPASESAPSTTPESGK
jgi:serine protease Do